MIEVKKMPMTPSKAIDVIQRWRSCNTTRCYSLDDCEFCKYQFDSIELRDSLDYALQVLKEKEREDGRV